MEDVILEVEVPGELQISTPTHVLGPDFSQTGRFIRLVVHCPSFLEGCDPWVKPDQAISALLFGLVNICPVALCLPLMELSSGAIPVLGLQVGGEIH